ncbi:uncharacterized protein B0P05DRAFT_571215 [Gilbertella persicaria]|uniref:uncharacterized protein n=1 Tax=Gilbertella persicaria TaxID=101096 RepID=UPI0022200236|nr:uncharacterized protein B0P05DRAFT_571215 [Gilbertella persicaria]KAI8080832.1 hypothetical protein B0P05DRAFT_571215 [Gilbertella persicaria]
MTVQRNTLENRTLPGNRNTPTTISSVIGNQMAKRLARVTFIQRQRLQICIEYFNEPKKNQEYMRHWAKREFSLSQLSLQSTISKIVSKHEKLAQMPDKDLDSSSSKEAKYPCLEEKS